MMGSASASSADGTATRTIWQPAAVSSAICCNVASMFAVTVVVIDCTDTGAPPPTGTLPTITCRDFLRGASAGGGNCGKPRSTGMFTGTSLDDAHRIHEVSHDQHQAYENEHGEDPETDRNQLTHVHEAGIRFTPEPGEVRSRPLIENHGNVPAIQRQQRQQVEQANEYVERGDDQDGEGDLLLPADVRTDYLTGRVTCTDDARHLAAGGARAVAGEQFRYRLGQLRDDRGRAAHHR